MSTTLRDTKEGDATTMDAPSRARGPEPHLRARLIRAGWFVLAAIALFVWLPNILESRNLFGLQLESSQLLNIGLPQVNGTLVMILGAVALNLIVGSAGLISLGHAAFFATGAFVAAQAGTQWGLPFELVLPLAGLAGAAVGILVGLPSLRLQGLYLMLATLSLHFIAMFLFLRYQLSQFGPSGITFELPTVFGFEINQERHWYFLLLSVVIVTLWCLKNMMKSRHGRAIIATRDHDIAAASLGVNVHLTRLRAFAVSSFVVSVAGALYAYYLGNLSSTSFHLDFVIGFFAMVIIGGMGSMVGAVLGAIVWTLLPKMLETVALEVGPDAPVVGSLLSDHRPQVVSIMLAVIIILILRFRPDGLSGILGSAATRVRGLVSARRSVDA